MHLLVTLYEGSDQLLRAAGTIYIAKLQRDHPHLRHCEDPRDPTPRSHAPHPRRPLHTTAHSDSIPTWSVLH